MSNSPGVFYNVLFTVPHSKQERARGKKFSNFLGYQDRKKAIDEKTENLSGFLDYQDNPLKSKGLIGMDGHYLSTAERRLYVEKYNTAEERGSVLWQDLFSFDTDWLIDHGLCDPESHQFDEKRIADTIRSTMDLVIQKEGLQQPLYCFAFHKNTDNLHAHVSMVERHPSRPMIRVQHTDPETGRVTFSREPAGFRKPATVRAAERHFVNELLQFKEPLTQVTNIIRQSIVGSARKSGVVYNPIFEQAILDLYKKLPNQRNRWLYGYSKGQHFQEPLDRLIRLYLATYHQEECHKLNQWLVKMDHEYATAYRKAPGRPERIKKNGSIYYNADMGKAYTKPLSGYRENKLHDLYSRLGNTILRELRTFDKEMRLKGIDDPKQLFAEKKLISTADGTSHHHDNTFHDKRTLNSNGEKTKAEHPSHDHEKHSYQDDSDGHTSVNQYDPHQGNSDADHDSSFDESRAHNTKGETSAGHQKSYSREQHKHSQQDDGGERPSYAKQFDSISRGNTLKANYVEQHYDPYLYRNFYRGKAETNRLLHRIDRQLTNDFRTWKNMQEYERMEREMEYRSEHPEI